MREKKRQQLGFADIELWQQGVRLDPLLEQISRFLDRHGELLDLVHGDLVRGLKKKRRGRRGLLPHYPTQPDALPLPAISPPFRSTAAPARPKLADTVFRRGRLIVICLSLKSLPPKIHLPTYVPS
jgi:hypothetical protein